MKKIKPDEVEVLTVEELNTLKSEAKKRSVKKLSTYEVLLKRLDPQTVEKNIKFIKKLDRKLSQFENFMKKDRANKVEGIEKFHQDIKDLISNSQDLGIKRELNKELEKIVKR